MLLFDAEKWVITPHMGQVLGGFQEQVMQRLTRRLLRWREDGKWEYTSSESARADAGFETMETYIRQSQNMVAQYISPRLLLDLCEATERNQRAQVGMRW